MPTHNSTHRPIAGILFCINALMFFALQDSLIVLLAKSYPLLEVLTLRSIIVLIILGSVGLYVVGGKVLYARRPLTLALRGMLAFLAFTSYYFALTQIPLADAAAVYMTAPLFVTLLSVPLLGEKVGWHRWAAVILGFSAVVVMLNPGSGVFRVVGAIPLFSALCYAMIPIINRKIGLTEHALTMAIYTVGTYLILILLLSLCLSLGLSLAPVGVSDHSSVARLAQPWIMFSAGDWLLVLLACCLFCVGLLSITQAYRIAIVSTVTPFEYSYLLWASLFGFVIFGDVPGLRTVAGGVVVVVCGLYIANRERKLAQALYKTRG